MSKVDLQKYFDLSEENLDQIEIKTSNKNKSCYIKYKDAAFREEPFISGFVIEKSPLVSTLVEVNFYPSSFTDKYIPRLTFFKVLNSTTEERDSQSSEKVRVTINSTKASENFWLLISFLLYYKNLVDTGDFEKSYSIISEDAVVQHVSELDAFMKNKTVKRILIETDLDVETIETVLNDKRRNAIKEYEHMLENKNLNEHDWQKWFERNTWVLGSDFVNILEERRIDTDNISDYLAESYDGFLDIVEIKSPNITDNFWDKNFDHGNYYPSKALNKAIMQSSKYIMSLEEESNSNKFLKRVRLTVVKPRCMLIFGRSHDWNDDQKKDYRVLNSSYHNIVILTYDHVLERAKRILNMSEVMVPDELPF